MEINNQVYYIANIFCLEFVGNQYCRDKKISLFSLCVVIEKFRVFNKEVKRHDTVYLNINNVWWVYKTNSNELSMHSNMHILNIKRSNCQLDKINDHLCL